MHDDIGVVGHICRYSGWPIVCNARPAVARLVEVSDPCLTTRTRLRCTTILASLVIYVGIQVGLPSIMRVPPWRAGWKFPTRV